MKDEDREDFGRVARALDFRVIAKASQLSPARRTKCAYHNIFPPPTPDKITSRLE
jgi:hypothetical protein